MQKSILIKWITLAILALSVVFFFLPYVTLFGESFTTISLPCMVTCMVTCMATMQDVDIIKSLLL